LPVKREAELSALGDGIGLPQGPMASSATSAAVHSKLTESMGNDQPVWTLRWAGSRLQDVSSKRSRRLEKISAGGAWGARMLSKAAKARTFSMPSAAPARVGRVHSGDRLPPPRHARLP